MGRPSSPSGATRFATCGAEPLLQPSGQPLPLEGGAASGPSFRLERSRRGSLLHAPARPGARQLGGWLMQLASGAQAGLEALQAQLGCVAPAGAAAFASLSARGQARGDGAKHPTCEHSHDLRQLFTEIDRKQQGFLDAHTMRVALSRLGLPCGKDYLDSLMSQYDQNHDGRIDFAEFASYVQRRQADMARAFDGLDAEPSGRHLGAIDPDTLVRVLQRAGLPAARADAQAMVAMLDADRDGKISFHEFCRFACLLPAAQVEHQHVVEDWLDSADFVQSMEYRLSMVPPKSSYQRLVAGGVAGAVSRTCVAPFERLRTILMTEPSMTPPEALRLIYRQRGIRGFWKGNLLTVVKTFPQSALQFWGFDTTKDVLTSLRPRADGKGLSQPEQVFAGCAAGCLSTLCTYPLEVLRTRASIAGGASSSSSSGVAGTVRQIWRQQGVGGFYQGLKCGLLCDMLSTGLGFWAYEMGQAGYRRLHEGAAPGPRDRGFIGGVSALFVMAATMPLEVCLRRLQAQGHPGRPVLYRNARHCLATILEQEGVRGLYRGMFSSFLKVGPSIGVTYALYALLVQTYGIGGVRGFSHLDRRDERALKADAAAQA